MPDIGSDFILEKLIKKYFKMNNKTIGSFNNIINNKTTKLLSNAKKGILYVALDNGKLNNEKEMK